MSGVIVMMLDANSNLTWRDVQHVLARSTWKNDGAYTGNNVILRQPKNISSFGEGPDGEAYILTDEAPQAGLYILVDP